MDPGTERRDPEAARLCAGLCATAVVSYCSYAMCRVPILPLYATALGAGPGVIGLVMGASTVTGILLKFPAGAWSDVVGRRRLLVLATLVYAVLPVTYPGAGSIGLLIAIRAVHGSASALFGPVAAATLSDAAPADRRGTWLGTYAFFQGAGQAAGPVIAGYLVAAYGFSTAFLAAGAVAAAAPLLALRLPLVQRSVNTRHPQALVQAFWALLQHPLILLTSVTQAAQYVQHGALSAFLPLYAGARFGLSPSEMGWLFAVQIGTTLSIRPLMGALSDRTGRRVMIAAGLTLSSAGVFAITVAGTAALLTSSVAAYAVGVALTTGSTAAYITDLSHRSRYGASHGLFGSIYDVGDAAGPLLGGVLVTVAGYDWMFRAVAVTGVLVAAWFIRASREPQSIDSAKTSST